MLVGILHLAKPRAAAQRLIVLGWALQLFTCRLVAHSVCVYIYICIYTCIHMYDDIITNMCMIWVLFASSLLILVLLLLCCVFMWVYLCMHACMYVCIYIYIYTHICTYTRIHITHVSSSLGGPSWSRDARTEIISRYIGRHNRCVHVMSRRRPSCKAGRNKKPNRTEPKRTV